MVAISVVSVEERVVLIYWSVALSMVMYLDKALGCLVWAKINILGGENTRRRQAFRRVHMVRRKNQQLFPAEVNCICDQLIQNSTWNLAYSVGSDFAKSAL
jgi:hypothetical protein